MAERSALQHRLYLSGTDERAFELAASRGLGYEVAAFCWAPMLEDASVLQREEQRAKAGLPMWLHAPFAELVPCAIDPLVRRVAAERYRQTAALAGRLGIHRIVIHGGFIPQVYYPVWYIEQSVLFWQEFLREMPEGITIALENVMELGPELLVDIVSRVNDPRLGLCLDVGHANTNISAVPPTEWVGPMEPWLYHVHIHNNLGDTDLHSPLGEGNIPMEQLLDRLLQTEATFTIENQNCLPSLEWLAEKGYLK